MRGDMKKWREGRKRRDGQGQGRGRIQKGLVYKDDIERSNETRTVRINFCHPPLELQNRLQVVILVLRARPALPNRFRFLRRERPNNTLEQRARV
jgi:hypothetical protein